MTRNLIVLLILFASIGARAQDKRGSFSKTYEPIIEGDTGVIGTFSAAYGCEIQMRQLLNNPKWNWDLTTGTVSMHANTNGVVRDTARIKYTVGYAYPPQYDCYDASGIYAFNAEITIRKNSFVTLRPKKWSVDLYPSPDRKGWHAVTYPVVSNRAKTVRKVYGWDLLGSQPLNGVTLKVYHKGTQIDTLYLDPGDTNIALECRISSTDGPMYDIKVLPVDFLTRAKPNTDTLMRSAVELRLHPQPWSASTAASLTELRLNVPSGSSLDTSFFVDLDPERELVLLDKLTHPFTIDTQSIAPNRLRMTLRASALEPGLYDQVFKLFTSKRDHQGRYRYDSAQIRMVLAADGVPSIISWEPCAGDVIRPEALVLREDGSIVALQNRAIYRSTNEGRSWTRHAEFDITCRGFAASTKNALITVTKNGSLLKFNEFTDLWDTILIGYPSHLRYTFQEVASYGDNLYVFGEYLVRYGREIIYEDVGFESTDDGASWHQWESAPRVVAIDSAYNFIRGYNAGLSFALGGGFTSANINGVAVDPQGNALVLTSDNGLFVTDDLGSSWHHQPWRFPRPTSLAVSPSGEIIVTSDSIGVYKAESLDSPFFPINGGLTDKHVTGLRVLPGFPMYITTRHSGVFRSKSRVELPLKVLTENTPKVGVIKIGSRYATVVGTRDVQPILLDVLGRRVELPLNFDADNSSWKIELATLPSGSYFIRQEQRLHPFAVRR